MNEAMKDNFLKLIEENNKEKRRMIIIEILDDMIIFMRSLSTELQND